MNKHYITAIIGGVMIAAGCWLGTWDRNFLYGSLTATGVYLLITITLGQFLAAKAAERMDKQQHDKYD